MERVTVTVFTRDPCTLCEDAIETIERVAAQTDVEIELRTVDVDDDPTLCDEYGDRVPYVFVGDRPAFKYHVDAAALQHKLEAAVE